MNKTIKKLFSSVLAVAMIFGAFCVTVSASDLATLSITEEAYDVAKTGEQIYQLTFKVTAPAGTALVTGTTITFSYDSTAVAPADWEYKEVLSNTSDMQYALVPYKEGSGRNVVEFKTAPGTPKVYTAGDRVGINYETYIDDTAKYVDATAGMAFAKFYYVIKDASKMNNDTFKLETEYSAGSSMLGQAYNDKTKAATIAITSQDGSALKYAPADETVAATIAEPTWSYTGYVASGDAKTQIDVKDVTVADVTKTYDGKAATVAAANLPVGVEATVAYSSVNAPVDAGEYTATVTLTATDTENTELVNIPEDLTATITINTVKVAIDVITIEGETTVQIPAELKLALANVPETVTATIEYKVGEDWVTTVPTEAGTYDVRVNVVAKDAKNYELTGEAATTTATILEADPVKEDLAVVTGVKELVINGKTYKDLYKVDVAISEGFVGKKITKYGVIFKDATEGATKGGAKIEVTPDTVIQIAEGGKFEFSAAVIGIPDTVTAVTATPFVWSK